ncbi:MAG: DUF1684 domain-containing protein [Ignavibacteriales bacterium]
MLIKAGFGSALLLLSAIVLIVGCNNNKSNDPEMKKYIEELNKERIEKDYSMQFDKASPFIVDTLINFEPLSYYEPNPDFIFKSKLFLNEVQDTITILGTKGEKRPSILIGYLGLNYKEKIYKLNVYKSFGRTGTEYYSIWFTDRTTGNETYGVGRYLEFELNDSSDFIYTIDFNRAYNPYCAYTALFTCPIPRKEDYIDIEIEAGEKNFH